MSNPTGKAPHKSAHIATSAKAAAPASVDPATGSTPAAISLHRPRRSDAGALDGLWVRPDALVTAWYERLRDSALTETRHHLLAIGPEGSGKSHLVAMLVHRLRAHKAVVARARIAWLPEDETTSSWSALLLRILRSLHGAYGEAFPLPEQDELRTAATDVARSERLSEHLLEHLGKATLIVVIEGLDAVLAGLGDEGCKRWRAFLQDHRVAATLATSRRITPDLSDRDRAFFNFFQLEHLPPLTPAQCVELSARVAGARGDEALEAFVRSPVGRSRVAALHHLAGGSARVFVSIGSRATVAGLDALRPVVDVVLDELTPMQRQRLARLPDQQRSIVEFLCRPSHTVPVKVIADALFVSQQTAASQLKVLREKGLVVSSTKGRESRYEPGDPLLRLCVDVGGQASDDGRAWVDLLRAGYERAELQSEGQPFTHSPTAAPRSDDSVQTLAAAVIEAFGSTTDRELRAERVLALAETAADEGQGALTSLCLAVTLGIGDPTYANANAEDLTAWVDAWRGAAVRPEASSHRAALALTTRLLDAGLRECADRDGRALLDLLSVERAVVRQAVQLLGPNAPDA